METIKKVYNIYKKPAFTGLSGELAFFFIWSLVPLVIVLGKISGLLQVSLDLLSEYINEYTVPEFAELVSPYLKTDIEFSFSMVTFLIFALYASSKSTQSVMRTSNYIYDVDHETNFIKRKIRAMLITFIMLFLIVFTLLLPVFGQMIFDLLYNLYDFSKITNFLFNFLQWPFSVFILYIGIHYIYLNAPNIELRNREVRFGALLTTFGWIIASIVFSYYLNNFANYEQLYGNLSNIIIVMFWFYILANIFIIGMILNVVLQAKRNNYHI